MRQINIIIFFWVVAIMLPSCIMPYEPHIESKDINKYVVSGGVTDNVDNQIVTVSRASPVGDPHQIPVTGCDVRIYDDKWHEFVMQESDEGTYSVVIDSRYLISGASFKVTIFTPDGTSIESDFDKMGECPDIDSVYYLSKEILSDKPDQDTKGIQFYINLDGRTVKTRFFKWEVIETWEYHVVYPREWYYDGSIHHIVPPDYSRKVCWSTQLVKNIYTLSTEDLMENRYDRLSLNFVDNHTSRLMYGYSLLINQFALSEAAYSYWDQMRINSSEQGGLYEKQPLSISGNLHNVTNPDQKVLGFFSASPVKSKRISVRNVENLKLDFPTFCSPGILRKGLIEITKEDYPVFLMGDEYGYWPVSLANECVDCLVLGGTNIKPYFWPF